jgi:hypothetical protein
MVSLETIVSGQTVELKWCCRGCGASWSVSAKETDMPDRRASPRDRRKSSRADRRKRQA